MKTLKNILITAALLLAAFIPAKAAPFPASIPGYSEFATGGTAIGATNSYGVISMESLNNKQAPVITFISCKFSGADTNAAKVQFYNCTNFTQINTNVSPLPGLLNGATNTVDSTNGFGIGTVVVLRHKASDTYERLVCNAPQNTNQVVFNTIPLVAPVSGDTIWSQIPTGLIPAQGGTNFVMSGSGIYSGQPACPMLVDVIGTVTPVLNAVNAIFR